VGVEDHRVDLRDDFIPETAAVGAYPFLLLPEMHLLMREDSDFD
jgi:hypothetical protein